ncbi:MULTISPECIES: hypothetical protein [Bacillales]|jgi:hypothetical protein|nr:MULTISPECIES: hypothetical protein [Bacillales]MBR8659358.1 hypothetical protein [Brevibacillus sp. NL20B1]MDT3414481.1 hypothetical protein [Brevibacillus aydinogluensis]UFJ60063.1 hypothetical protein IRT44_12150 [Anoxybacillus sediminis]
MNFVDGFIIQHKRQGGKNGRQIKKEPTTMQVIGGVVREYVHYTNE